MPAQGNGPSGVDNQLQEVHSCSDFELRGIQKAAAVMVNMHQKKGDESEGFTRSISLYWHWVRGQKAASKMGKVNRGSGTRAVDEKQQKAYSFSCALHAAKRYCWLHTALETTVERDLVVSTWSCMSSTANAALPVCCVLLPLACSMGASHTRPGPPSTP